MKIGAYLKNTDGAGNSKLSATDRLRPNTAHPATDCRYLWTAAGMPTARRTSTSSASTMEFSESRLSPQPT